MRSVREKLEAAIDEMVKEGAKISPYAVEKRAKVSNKSVEYHADIAERVYELKVAQRTDRHQQEEKAKKGKKANITQEALDKKNEALKNVNRLKAKYHRENKSLIAKEQLWAAQIGNLTMALHNERSQVNSASEVIQLPKRGKQ
ncbi:hypothetical protein V12B01_24999 [Vibrio splendidus 12B01]|uniref:hypothetical protein n=1 Tax=Vibrio TaxID=662 RepID=UPI000066F8F5|nr:MULTISPECIES: hypothetical protein [Vibrio]EAP96284.1 hypothetical protein V12B01_24999 [Vibrio splendidus 12B01]TKF96876.1 hypothetical protein FCV71_10395 [Vibrio lentus]